MPLSQDYYEFATVLDIQPPSQANTLFQHLKVAPVAPGMRVEIRTPTLAFFVVEAPAEFLAVAKAEEWIKNVAGGIRPSITINVNAQPSNEI